VDVLVAQEGQRVRNSADRALETCARIAHAAMRADDERMAHVVDVTRATVSEGRVEVCEEQGKCEQEEVAREQESVARREQGRARVGAEARNVVQEGAGDVNTGCARRRDVYEGKGMGLSGMDSTWACFGGAKSWSGSGYGWGYVCDRRVCVARRGEGKAGGEAKKTQRVGVWMRSGEAVGGDGHGHVRSAGGSERRTGRGSGATRAAASLVMDSYVLQYPGRHVCIRCVEVALMWVRARPLLATSQARIQPL
jgi:hypothetical protein